MVAEKQLGRISSRLGTGRASYSQPSTPKGNNPTLGCRTAPLVPHGDDEGHFCPPTEPGVRTGEFLQRLRAAATMPCRPGLLGLLPRGRERGRDEGSKKGHQSHQSHQKVLAPAVRDSPCHMPATAGGPSHAIPLLRGGRTDGGDRSGIHARRRVAESGNANVDG